MTNTDKHQKHHKNEKVNYWIIQDFWRIQHMIIKIWMHVGIGPLH